MLNDSDHIEIIFIINIINTKSYTIHSQIFLLLQVVSLAEKCRDILKFGDNEKILKAHKIDNWFKTR